MRRLAPIWVILFSLVAFSVDAKEPLFDQDPIYTVNGNEITITLPFVVKDSPKKIKPIELHNFTYNHLFSLVNEEKIDDIIVAFPDLLRMDDRVRDVYSKQQSADGYTYTFKRGKSNSDQRTEASARFNYLRTGKGFKVHDLAGGEPGRIYLFGKTAFAGKKKSDPNPLNYDAVYLDKSGQKVFQSQFEFGHKKNALDPVFAYHQNGQIHILVKNIKAKDAFSRLSFDLTGKLVSQTAEQSRKALFDLIKTANYRITKNRYPNLTLDDWVIQSVRTDATGNIFAIGQLSGSKTVKVDNQTKWIDTYKSPFVLQLNDQEITQIYIFDNYYAKKSETTKPARLFPIRATSDHLMILAKKTNGRQGVQLLKVQTGKQPATSKFLGQGMGLNVGLRRAYNDEKRLYPK